MATLCSTTSVWKCARLQALPVFMVSLSCVFNIWWIHYPKTVCAVLFLDPASSFYFAE